MAPIPGLGLFIPKGVEISKKCQETIKEFLEGGILYIKVHIGGTSCTVRGLMKVWPRSVLKKFCKP